MNDVLTAFERVVRSANTLNLSSTSRVGDVHPFDERNIHTDISSVALKLFDDGHYAQATFEAFKYLEVTVKRLSRLSETGFTLMMKAFDEKKPAIKLNNMANQSDSDEQKGYRYLFAGSISGIRNPRGHENRIDSIDVCLDHLSVASVLLRALEARKSH